MATWAQFAAADPGLAELGRERLEETGLALVGTLRANGWPRISPVEPLFHAGRLYLGMMWCSRKALDLLRDPRCVVHNVHADKTGGAGDFKVYGRALAIDDADEVEGYSRALQEAIGWRPEGDFHLFAVDVEEVGFIRAGAQRDVRTWRARA